MGVRRENQIPNKVGWALPENTGERKVDHHTTQGYFVQLLCKLVEH